MIVLSLLTNELYDSNLITIKRIAFFFFGICRYNYDVEFN